MSHILQQGNNILQSNNHIFGVKTSSTWIIERLSGRSGYSGLCIDYENNLLLASKAGTASLFNLSDFSFISNKAITGGDSIVLDVANNRVFVANGNLVSIYNYSTWASMGTISGFSTIFGMTIDPENGRLFVANYGNNTVSIVSLSTLAITSTLTGFNGPVGLLFDSPNNRIVINNYGNNTVRILDATTLTQVGSTLSGFNQPFGIAKDPMDINNRVLVANAGGGTVSILKSNTLTQLTTISGFKTPRFIVFNPNNIDQFIITNGADDIMVVTEVKY